MPQEAMRRLFNVERDLDYLGNYEPLTDIYPDKDAPTVRSAPDGRPSLRNQRWGFPSPQPRGRPVTNVRNLSSPYWRNWLSKANYRCVVPATSFAEPHPTRKDERGWTDNEWFAVTGVEGFAFAGIWRPWKGERSVGNRQKEEREWDLFSILTCMPNGLVGAIHPRAMPVILHPSDYETWLNAPWPEAEPLVKSFPASEMQIVKAAPA